jgi:hypothetical protein
MREMGKMGEMGEMREMGKMREIGGEDSPSTMNYEQSPIPLFTDGIS